MALIERLNADSRIHGILVQLPLSVHIDTNRALHRIDPRKDVDGFHPENVGKVALGDPTGFRPATPYGVQQLLIRTGVETSGKHAVVLGRSNIVGRPMARLLLLDAPGGNATVTVCHSRSRAIEQYTRQADILVVAIGKPEFVTGSMIKPGAVVIDVGVNRVDDPTRKQGYRLVGDVKFQEAKQVASAITPVPGGVGPMTITMLLYNTVQGARQWPLRHALKRDCRRCGCAARSPASRRGAAATGTSRCATSRPSCAASCSPSRTSDCPRRPTACRSSCSPARRCTRKRASSSSRRWSCSRRSRAACGSSRSRRRRPR